MKNDLEMSNVVDFNPVNNVVSSIGNLALKSESILNDTESIETYEKPKVLTWKIEKKNRIFALCWQLGGNEDC